MAAKRRRSNVDEPATGPIAKRTRTRSPLDFISQLSDELLIRILHHLPLPALLRTHCISHRFYTLSTDSQIWKNLYYNRFVLPRALRIPGIKSAHPEHALHFSSRRSKWLDESTLVEGKNGNKTNWKCQYKLRHNWSIGACEVQEIRVTERPVVPSLLVKLAEGIVITADKEDGLRAWDLKERLLVARCEFVEGLVPTCLALDEPENGKELRIAIGFKDGGWGTWEFDIASKGFTRTHQHPKSSNGTLSALAYCKPYVLTMTESQLLSLYSFTPTPSEEPTLDDMEDNIQPGELAQVSMPAEVADLQAESFLDMLQPRLLASLRSHTSWPPLSLSIRNASSTIIASIAYSLPTYLSGYTVGLQELHLDPSNGVITSSRLSSALPALTPSVSPTPPPSVRPTTLSYSHPYILATHPDNTLTLYLCTSTSSSLSVSSGVKLWGHTSSVASAEITARGKAVSVCSRGEELRVWELEGGLLAKRRDKVGDRSVMIRAERKDAGDYLERRQWVGFDDEVAIVLKESGEGAQALMIYDFT